MTDNTRRVFKVVIHMPDHSHFEARVEMTEAEAQAFRQQLVQMEIDGKIRKDFWIIDAEHSDYSSKHVADFLAR